MTYATKVKKQNIRFAIKIFICTFSFSHFLTFSPLILQSRPRSLFPFLVPLIQHTPAFILQIRLIRLWVQGMTYATKVKKQNIRFAIKIFICTFSFSHFLRFYLEKTKFLLSIITLAEGICKHEYPPFGFLFPGSRQLRINSPCS